MNTTDSNLPQVRKTIQEVIENRNKALSKYFEALEVVREARFYHGLLSDRTFDVKINGKYICDSEDLPKEKEDIRKALDREVWKYLAEETGLFDLMDEEAKNSFDHSLKEEVLEITEENVMATYAALSERKEEIFYRGIFNVFKYLSKTLVTNDSFRIGKKIILQNYFADSAFHSLQDVERIFYILDKKTPPTYNESVVNYMRMNSIQGIPLADVENEYFVIKSYKNNRIHLIFKRPDLVEKINKVISSWENGSVRLGDRSKSKNWRNKTTIRKSA
ncbi:DUF4942 domain-containing protein [Leptospira sp. id769339]|uniref:DUF4942 domain-containing protein n=1 Tax=Leptospira sp. id769339 TaxID=2864221 RepID=UPI00214CDAE2|nr:DUF4942 domain-containing protein [Leptospira sp. id769339]MCR1795368.1 DUF4942 domain-containing protein [Leptospira sp. id769339]